MIKFYNRKTGEYEIEKVSAQRMIKWSYESPTGMGLLELIFKKRYFSRFIGWYFNKSISKRKIKKFIQIYNINTKELVKSPEEFTCFNDFFIRGLKESAREVNYSPEVLISPCDSKVLAYENVSFDNLFEIKGFKYTIPELINNTQITSEFTNSTCLIFRLSPTDYHRFHFIDNGTCEPTNKILGDYYSVNPVALKKIPEILCKNKREWSIFHSQNFGDMLYIEVGATFVGSILQTYTPNSPVSKGDEKGYFKFGGSTVILIIKSDKVKIDDDILLQTKKGFETKISYGEKIGRKK